MKEDTIHNLVKGWKFLGEGVPRNEYGTQDDSPDDIR